MSSKKLQIHTLPIGIIVLVAFVMSLGLYGRSASAPVSKTIADGMTARLVNITSEKNGLAKITLNHDHENRTPQSVIVSTNPVLNVGWLSAFSFNASNPPASQYAIN